MSVDFQLEDLPDFSAVDDGGPSIGDQWADAWYQGVIVDRRAFTDKNGNDRVFESTDAPSNNGDSRNIRLQVQITRAADGKTLNSAVLVNYRPDDLTQETIQALTAHQEKVKAGEEKWGPLFRSFMTITRLGKLQKIADVRSFQRSENGGLNLAPLFGKTGYFKLGPDERNPQFKEIRDYRSTRPTKAQVL